MLIFYEMAVAVLHVMVIFVCSGARHCVLYNSIGFMFREVNANNVLTHHLFPLLHLEKIYSRISYIFFYWNLCIRLKN